MLGAVCFVGLDLVRHGRLVARPNMQEEHLGGLTLARTDGSRPALTILNILEYERWFRR